jgi:hypothetical protein
VTRHILGAARGVPDPSVDDMGAIGRAPRSPQVERLLSDGGFPAGQQDQQPDNRPFLTRQWEKRRIQVGFSSLRCGE